MTLITQDYLDKLTYKIIGAAIVVHKELGPGLYEKVYEKCLEKELQDLRLKVESQQSVPVVHKGLSLDCEIRYDLLVENAIVVELKAVEILHPLFESQLLTYMKLLKKPKGILLNFNVGNIFKEGQKTFVNEYFRQLD
jgi:GxxExxY protein